MRKLVFFKRLVLLCVLTGTALRADSPSAPSLAGEKLGRVFDAMDVEHLWIHGYRVNWETGEALAPSAEPAHSTHCSAFVAAACQRLGVPILHPPEHPLKLLANAQYDWLRDQGARNGWQPLATAADAQARANAGALVAAVYRNPDGGHPGHIALVRPALKSSGELAADGPDIIQAGARNYRQTTVRQGFAHHPGAFENGQILYFAHALPP